MRRIMLFLAAIALLAAMMAVSTLPALASNGFEASGGASCNQGTEHAQNEAVPSAHDFPGIKGTNTAEHNIPTEKPGPNIHCK